MSIYHIRHITQNRFQVAAVCVSQGVAGQELRVQDVIDFWRVESIIPDERLLLQAEMRMPGCAWLEFTIAPRWGLGCFCLIFGCISAR